MCLLGSVAFLLHEQAAHRRQGVRGHLDRVQLLPEQIHHVRPNIADLDQCLANHAEIDVPCAKGQVTVDAPGNVLQVQVDDTVSFLESLSL